MSHGDRATDNGTTIEDVIENLLRRAEYPRPRSHADELAQQVVDKHGRSAAAECVRLIFQGDMTRRQAGSRAFGEDSYLDGLTVGSAVSIYLHRAGVPADEV